MVAVASEALPAADVRVGRLGDPLPGGPNDLIISVLAVHHLPSEQKRELFERVAVPSCLAGASCWATSLSRWTTPMQ